MYCKKCGNELEPGDRFCNQCGTKVVSDEPEPIGTTDFSPMFKKESGPDTEPVSNKPSKRNFHIEDFNWDLDGYPTEKKTRTEDIDFNWESVLTERDRRIKEERTPLFRDEPEAAGPKSEGIEPEVIKPAFEAVEPEVIKPTFEAAGPEAEPLIEETRKPVSQENKTATLEKEIFGDLQEDANPDMQKTVRIDKFYTFNKKNAEFQALLDKEYERLKNGIEAEEELVTTEQVLGNIKKADPVVPPAVEAAAEPVQEEPVAMEAPVKEPVKESNGVDLVGVAFADTPNGTIAYEEEKGEKSAAEIKEVESKVCPPSEEKTEESKEEPDHKLTFDDIFADDDEDGDDNKKPTKKKHTALKVIAVILCILIVLELVVIGLTHFAPESDITQWIISIFNKIENLFTGDVPKG